MVENPQVRVVIDFTDDDGRVGVVEVITSRQ
jgi:hypothetical protein